jgi:hypothetical protein
MLAAAGDDAYEERCGACRRIGGPAVGADEETARGARSRQPVDADIAKVPTNRGRANER